MQDEYIVYTDGSALENPGPGGYGVVIRHDNKLIKLKGGFHKTTNNRMEILAVIIALREIGPYKKITVHSDSAYTINAATKWIYGWKKNDWITTSGVRVKNKDLFIELDELRSQCELKFVKVKAHTGIPDNELADQLAKEGASNPTQDDVGYLEELTLPKETPKPTPWFQRRKRK